MARPKGSKNRPKSTPKIVPSASAGPGHNSEMTDERRQKRTIDLTADYQKAIAAKKAADAHLKNVCKVAKADLGPGALDDIKLAIELGSDEGRARFLEKQKEEHERKVRLGRWYAMDIGSQSDFDFVDRTPREDKIGAEGKRAGLAGEQRIPPSHYSQPDCEHWYRGYDAGQAAIRDQMADAFTAPTTAPSGEKIDDAFDDALGDAGDEDEDDGDTEDSEDEQSEDETEEAAF